MIFLHSHTQANDERVVLKLCKRVEKGGRVDRKVPSDSDSVGNAEVFFN